MDNKIIKKGNASQEDIIIGAKKAIDAIKTTIGPAGKSVALETSMGGYPDITRDGATVAKSINFSNPGYNMGAQLVKKAASLTEEMVGDATSSCSLLIGEFCTKGQKAIKTGSNVNEIKSGMLKAGKWINSYIKEKSTPINGDFELIKKVATISANNDPEVGGLVVEGMKKVGVDGLLVADVAAGLDTVIDITSGLKVNRGWSSPQYVTDGATGDCVMENPFIAVIGEKLSSVNQIAPIMQDLVNEGQGRPLLIICDSIDEVVNSVLVLNTLRGVIRCCVVQGIDFGDNRKNVMNDIAVATGGLYICKETGLSISEAKLDQFGSAAKVVISKDSCVIYNGGGNPAEIKKLADLIKARLSSPDISDYDKTKYSNRLAGLTGGIAIIKAGGATEAEKSNRKATIEDSILAAKSAIEEGFVPGGGYVYFRASIDYLKDKAFLKSLVGDELEGASIIFSSLPIVMKTIAENCGASGDVILETTKRKTTANVGFNAKTKKFGNLVDEGILDSTKAVRVALENSISTAAMILLIDCTIIDDPEEDNNKENKTF